MASGRPPKGPPTPSDPGLPNATVPPGRTPVNPLTLGDTSTNENEVEPTEMNDLRSELSRTIEVISTPSNAPENSQISETSTASRNVTYLSDHAGTTLRRRRPAVNESTQGTSLNHRQPNTLGQESSEDVHRMFDDSAHRSAIHSNSTAQSAWYNGRDSFEAPVRDVMQSDRLFYCHNCNCVVPGSNRIVDSGIVCPICLNDFVEELTEGIEQVQQEEQAGGLEQIIDLLETSATFQDIMMAAQRVAQEGQVSNTPDPSSVGYTRLGNPDISYVAALASNRETVPTSAADLDRPQTPRPDHSVNLSETVSRSFYTPLPVRPSLQMLPSGTFNSSNESQASTDSGVSTEFSLLMNVLREMMAPGRANPPASSVESGVQPELATGGSLTANANTVPTESTASASVIPTITISSHGGAATSNSVSLLPYQPWSRVQESTTDMPAAIDISPIVDLLMQNIIREVLASSRPVRIGNNSLGNPFGRYPVGNYADYASSNLAFERIITQLLNQAEGGQPPATIEVIQALPTVKVTERLSGNGQCSVCLENFLLSESVPQLPCKHIFHEECIRTWLLLHGTCPVCRLNLNKPPSKSEEGGSDDNLPGTGRERA